MEVTTKSLSIFLKFSKNQPYQIPINFSLAPVELELFYSLNAFTFIRGGTKSPAAPFKFHPACANYQKQRAR